MKDLYSDEELADLTEEERAAIEGDDGSGEDDEGSDDAASTPEGNDDAGGDDDGAGDAGDGDPGEGAADAKKPPLDADGQPAATDESAQAPPAPAPEQQQAPLNPLPSPEELEAKLGEIDGHKAALRKQYDDGELTFDEYETQKDALDDQRLEARDTLKDIQRAEKIAVDNWRATVRQFTTDNGYVQGTPEWNELDLYVKTIGQANPQLSYTEVLDKAHRIVRGAAPAQQQQQQQPPQAPKGKPATGEPPLNLAKVPAADVNTATNSRFASLDAIRDSGDPEAFEDALARLSDDEAEAYLSAR